MASSVHLFSLIASIIAIYFAGKVGRQGKDQRSGREQQQEGENEG
jgi:hypothetical protein